MNKIPRICLFGFLLAVAAGCSQTTEFGRVIWGSSIRSLEAARSGAPSQTFAATVEDCYRTVLQMTRREKFSKDIPEKPFYLFIADRARRTIVVMKVPGSVDTTEVGIFFDPAGDHKVTVDVASLSSNAALAASDLIFKALAEKFPAVDEIQPTDKAPQ